jgi:hypothetical protein
MRKAVNHVFGLSLCLFIISFGTGAMGATVFEDYFDSGLGNWTVGVNTVLNTTPILNPGGEYVSVVNGEAAFNNGYSYIETNTSFGDSFEVSMQVRRTSGSNQNFDFLVEIVEVPEYSGMMRFQYGTDDVFIINVGAAPSISGSEAGDAVAACNPDFQQTLDRNGEDQVGTMTYTYSEGAMKFAFTHETLGTIETPWINTGVTFSSTTIRIWAMGSGASGNGTRLIDNVRIDSPVTLSQGMLVDGAGNLYLGAGEGTPLHVLGNISCTGSVTEGSSRSLKRNISAITPDEAKAALGELQPVKYYYKADATHDQHAGFIAEEVPDLLATPDRKGLSAMDIVAILTKVVQKQQEEIDWLKQQLEKDL